MFRETVVSFQAINEILSLLDRSLCSPHHLLRLHLFRSFQSEKPILFQSWYILRSFDSTFQVSPFDWVFANLDVIHVSTSVLFLLLCLLLKLILKCLGCLLDLLHRYTDCDRIYSWSMWPILKRSVCFYSDVSVTLITLHWSLTWVELGSRWRWVRLVFVDLLQ